MTCLGCKAVQVTRNPLGLCGICLAFKIARDDRPRIQFTEIQPKPPQMSEHDRLFLKSLRISPE